MEKNLNRKELAMENFLKGYNCTQSVLLAFEDLLPEENRKEIICMASSFGGGMGRLREVCGSVSGMFLVAGLLYGYEGDMKQDRRKQNFILKYKNLHISLKNRMVLLYAGNC